MSTLKVPGLKKRLLLESILWIEGDGNYAWLHFSNRPKLVAAQTLKWFADQLPSFLRVHKSSLANLAHVAHFERNKLRGVRVILSNGVALLVARRRVEYIAHRLAKIGL